MPTTFNIMQKHTKWVQSGVIKIGYNFYVFILNIEIKLFS